MKFLKSEKIKNQNIYSKRIPLKELEKFFEEENSLKGRGFTFHMKEMKK